MHRDAIVRLLPLAYQRAAEPGSVLGALVEVMSELHAPDEALLESVDALFAPYQTTDRLVGFLAGWVAIDHVLPPPGPSADPLGRIPPGRLRNLVASGSVLAQLRGTSAGLRMFLEIATGVRGFGIDEPPERRFHFVVRVPAGAAGQLELVRRIVSAEKPAATTWDWVVEGEAS